MIEKMSRTEDTKIFKGKELEEVKKLLADGRTFQEILNYIKYKNLEESVVSSIMEFLQKYKKKIHKVASIFINAFERKYKGNFYSMSLSKFFSIVTKYKEKYGLNNEEFKEVIRLFETKIYNKHGIISKKQNIFPNTNLSRALGYPVVEDNSNILMTTDDDYSYLNDIIRLYFLYRPKHSYLIIQTMLYKEFSTEVINGGFDKAKHDINICIHPLIAALFIPKFKSIEERMLYANIAGIVNMKHNKERILTKPDYELFYSLVVDPTDVVCDVVSPIKDLKNRAEIQIQLWDNVYNLRNGKFYDPLSINFMAFIDRCKLSNFDNPDLLYQNDEGVILRRLFSVFAFRPIIIFSVPVDNSIVHNPLNIPLNVAKVTTIPYITFKLPQFRLEDTEIKLESAIKQVQLIFEGNRFVPKLISIIDNNEGPIIFHVPRRYIKLPLSLSFPQYKPLTLNVLYNSTMHYNQINTTLITVDFSINIDDYQKNQKKYLLKSALCYDVTGEDDNIINNIIKGQTTYLFEYEDHAVEIPSQIYYYSPSDRKVLEGEISPIGNYDLESTQQLLQKHACILIYYRDTVPPVVDESRV